MCACAPQQKTTIILVDGVSFVDSCIVRSKLVHLDFPANRTSSTNTDLLYRYRFTLRDDIELTLHFVNNSMDWGSNGLPLDLNPSFSIDTIDVSVKGLAKSVLKSGEDYILSDSLDFGRLFLRFDFSHSSVSDVDRLKTVVDLMGKVDYRDYNHDVRSYTNSVGDTLTVTSDISLVMLHENPIRAVLLDTAPLYLSCTDMFLDYRQLLGSRKDLFLDGDVIAVQVHDNRDGVNRQFENSVDR
jgi:hypothetical protein